MAYAIEFYFYILPKNAVSNVTITSTSNVFRILDYNTSTGLISALSRDIEQTFTISCSGYITQTVTYYGDDTTFNVTLTPFIAILVDENNKPIMLNDKVLVYTLPDVYTKVDYIASTGTQYIDTNVIPRSNNLIYEWEGRDDTPSGNTSLFASEHYITGSSSVRDFSGVLHGNNTKRNIYIGRTTGMTVGYSSTDGLFHKWSLNISSDHKLFLTKDGTKLTVYNWTGDINKYNTIFLYCNHVTSGPSQYAKVAYRYFKIRDEVGLLFYGIPARRNSDQVLGMYDLITKTFFVNKGTGSFVTE